MSETRAVALIYSDKSSSGTLELQHRDTKERTFRAAKVMIITFFVAVIGFFVPLLHLILPPLILVVGFLLARRTYKTECVVLNGTGPCPACDVKVSVMPRVFSTAFSDVCESCHREIRFKVS